MGLMQIAAMVGAVVAGDAGADPAQLVDDALRRVVVDFCAGRLMDPAADEEALAKKTGVELLAKQPAAGPFAGAQSMRGLFALRPSAASKAMIDGISATGSARGACLVRVVDYAPGAGGLFDYLKRAPGWTAETPENHGTVQQVTFRRAMAGQDYDIGVDITRDTGPAVRPDGMKALISVAKIAKAR
jgi:hypothetical protein